MFYHRVDDEIRLKLLEHRDAEPLFRLTDQNRAYLRQWMPWIDGTRTPDDTRHFIEEARRKLAHNEGMTVGILYEGKLCGVIDYHAMNHANKRTAIGYWLAESLQGRGIMTRVCRAFTGYAFSALEMNRVEIMAGTENVRSRAIPERLGFAFEGTARQAMRLHDRYIDLAMYSMLAEDWSG